MQDTIQDRKNTIELFRAGHKIAAWGNYRIDETSTRPNIGFVDFVKMYEKHIRDYDLRELEEKRVNDLIANR